MKPIDIALQHYGMRARVSQTRNTEGRWQAHQNLSNFRCRQSYICQLD